MSPTPVLFQALPPLSPEEYADLERSILESGVLIPILLDENGVVIDGHHRQQIAQHHNLPCPSETRAGLGDAEKRSLALTLNIARRHLTREQKRALVAESIKADPQLSDREHGRRAGVDKNTAAAVRDELETTGEIHQLDRTIGADGKERPASRPKPVTDTGPEPSSGFITPADLDALNTPHEGLDEFAPTPELDEDELAEQVIEEHAARPIPTPHSAPKPRQRPLPQQMQDVAWDIRQAVERLSKLTTDERFPKNKQQASDLIRGHLLYVSETVAAVLSQLDQ